MDLQRRGQASVQTEQLTIVVVAAVRHVPLEPWGTTDTNRADTEQFDRLYYSGPGASRGIIKHNNVENDRGVISLRLPAELESYKNTASCGHACAELQLDYTSASGTTGR